MSERRDSNPRPRPWQGRALPADYSLFPRNRAYKNRNLFKILKFSIFLVVGNGWAYALLKWIVMTISLARILSSLHSQADHSSRAFSISSKSVGF